MAFWNAHVTSAILVKKRERRNAARKTPHHDDDQSKDATFLHYFDDIDGGTLESELRSYCFLGCWSSLLFRILHATLTLAIFFALCRCPPSR